MMVKTKFHACCLTAPNSFILLNDAVNMLDKWYDVLKIWILQLPTTPHNHHLILVVVAFIPIIYQTCAKGAMFYILSRWKRNKSIEWINYSDSM